MGLPLQPGRPLPPWATGALLVVAGLIGLVLLGAAGLQRRPPTTVVLTAPDQANDYGAAAERLIQRAQRRVWLMQFVIRRDDSGVVQRLMNDLAEAHDRGVEVRVVLDQGLVYGTDRRDDRNDDASAWFAAHHIPVVLDEPNRTTHAKVLLCDDAVLIGSHNWTHAALTSNREASVLTTGSGQVAAVERLFASVPGW